MMALRSLRPEDGEKIQRIAKNIFSSPSQWPSLLFLQAPSTRGWVVEEKNLFLGYAIGSIVLDEAELSWIGVLPQFRRQGLGKKLLQAFIQGVRKEGARQVFLEVRADNGPAIALYDSFGFERIALRRGYYGDADAIVMRLAIGPLRQESPERSRPG
ncbi:MAG: ribosomal protein S18-alanine N-acetyltransferase [Sandaracinaceae bacterium]|nr:ribosomal protein S18-alanine N-acetyltransferase [Sandaracinaceae bacterium]